MAIPLQKREYFECKYSNQLQPVSCIASFSNQGGVRPQYIQVTAIFRGCQPQPALRLYKTGRKKSSVFSKKIKKI